MNYYKSAFGRLPIYKNGVYEFRIIGLKIKKALPDFDSAFQISGVKIR
jgi:hypothetical protein